MNRKNQIHSVLALAAGAVLGGLLAPMWMVVQLSNGFLTAEFDQPYSARTAYYLFLGAVALGGVISGFLKDRFSGRAGLLAGAAAAFAGCLGASLMPDGFYGFYCVAGGLGFGMLLLAGLCGVQEWAPRQKGLACGLIFGGFALVNAALVSPLRRMVKLEGLSGLLMACAVLALVGGVLAALALGKPSEEFRRDALSGNLRIQPSSKQYTVAGMLKTVQFYQLAVSMVIAFSFYCMVSQRLGVFGELKGLEYTAHPSYLSMVAAAVALGAVVLGAASDYLRRKPSLLGLFVIATVGGFLTGKFTGMLFWVGGFIAGLALGGCLSAFPAVLTDFYGEEHAGANSAVGLLFFPGALAALDAAANGLAQQQNGLAMPFEFAMLVPIVGIFLIFILQRPTAPKLVGARPAPQGVTGDGEDHQQAAQEQPETSQDDK